MILIMHSPTFPLVAIAGADQERLPAHKEADTKAKRKQHAGGGGSKAHKATKKSKN